MMTEQERAEQLDVPLDGFCPRCGALEDQMCQRPDGSPIPDHKVRHPHLDR